MSDTVERSWRDHDGTRQTSSINVDSGATPAERATLSTQLNLWSAGAPDGHVDTNEITAPTGASSSNPVAQGAVQGIIEMTDAVTGQVYRERIPMARLDKADDAGPDPAWIVTGQGANKLTVANPDHADYATFATAIEAVYESPNGNAGTLSRIYIEN